MDGSSHSQPASNKVDAKKPNVGGLAEGRHREEAFAGRKPNNKWTGLDDPHAINFPLPNPDAINQRKNHHKSVETHQRNFP